MVNDCPLCCLTLQTATGKASEEIISRSISMPLAPYPIRQSLQENREGVRPRQGRRGTTVSPLHFSETQTTVPGSTLCGLAREHGARSAGARVHLVHDHVLELLVEHGPAEDERRQRLARHACRAHVTQSHKHTPQAEKVRTGTASAQDKVRQAERTRCDVVLARVVEPVLHQNAAHVHNLVAACNKRSRSANQSVSWLMTRQKQRMRRRTESRAVFELALQHASLACARTHTHHTQHVRIRAKKERLP